MGAISWDTDWEIAQSQDQYISESCPSINIFHLASDFVTDLHSSQGNMIIMIFITMSLEITVPHSSTQPTTCLCHSWEPRLTHIQILLYPGGHHRGTQFTVHLWVPPTIQRPSWVSQEIDRFLRTFCATNQEDWVQFLILSHILDLFAPLLSIKALFLQQHPLLPADNHLELSNELSKLCVCCDSWYHQWDINMMYRKKTFELWNHSVEWNVQYHRLKL